MSHVLPNSLGPVIVQATLTLATAIIEVAALSFLGLGQPGPGRRRVGRDAGRGPGPTRSRDRALAICPASASPSPRWASPCSARRCARRSTRSLRRVTRPIARWPRAAKAARGRQPVGHFAREGRDAVHAVDGVSFSVDAGEVVGMVGESGCGKSVTSLAIMGLLPKPGVTVSGEAVFGGTDLLAADARTLRDLRGRDDRHGLPGPDELAEPGGADRRPGDRGAAPPPRHDAGRGQGEAADLLRRCGIPDPRRRLKEYPHQLSGGMRQRALIAIALACKPRAADLRRADHRAGRHHPGADPGAAEGTGPRPGTAMIMITHDLGVVAGLCDFVNVHVRGPGRRDRQPAGAVRAAPAPLHRRAAGTRSRGWTPPAASRCDRSRGLRRDVCLVAGRARSRRAAIAPTTPVRPTGPGAAGRRSRRSPRTRCVQPGTGAWRRPAARLTPAEGVRAVIGDDDLLEVAGLKVHFPIKQGRACSTGRSGTSGRSTASTSSVAARPDVRAGGGVRLRQVHARPGDAAARGADRRAR